MDFILRESLKLGTQNHYLDGIPSLFSAAQLLKSPTFVHEKDQHRSERVAIGLLLRNKVIHNGSIGAHWVISLLFALIQELVPHYDVIGDTIDGRR